MKKVTKKAQQDLLKDKLRTSRKWAIQGLMRIYEFQSPAEQSTRNTIEINGAGFTAFDAEILTSLAMQWKGSQSLSEKQWELVLGKMPKYWRQLLEISDKEKLNKLIAA